MLLSSLLLFVPFIASGVFSAPAAPGAPASTTVGGPKHPDEDYELTIKWKRDVDISQFPDKVGSQLKALGIDGAKGDFYVNGEKVQPKKRDLSSVKKGPDEDYELTIKW